MLRQLSSLDKFLSNVNDALDTLFVMPAQTRKNPAKNINDTPLTETERKNSIGCMRVNHTGEVCAQALYRGQLLACRDTGTRQMLETACAEESDHLAWTQSRLQELHGKTSYLNPFFYLNSFFIGALASFLGDGWSLGFVEETEIQVAKHLSSHLHKLSEKDTKSRSIVAQMRDDEIVHEKNAAAAGARELPDFIKQAMKCHAKVMTVMTFYL